MSITKLAQEIESLEKIITEKRGELMQLLGGGTLLVTPKKTTPAAKPRTKVVQGPSISERVRSELSKRPRGISFTDLTALPSLAKENKASVKSVLKKDRADNRLWFDGELYIPGAKPVPANRAKKKTPSPVKAKGSGSSGEQVAATS